FDFLARFAYARERAFHWITACGDDTKQLATGNDVKARARIDEQFQDRAVGVRFDRVTNQVIDGPQRRAESHVVVENCSRAVNVSRSAEFFGNACEIAIFAIQLPGVILKKMHVVGAVAAATAGENIRRLAQAPLQVKRASGKESQTDVENRDQGDTQRKNRGHKFFSELQHFSEHSVPRP